MIVMVKLMSDFIKFKTQSNPVVMLLWSRDKALHCHWFLSCLTWIKRYFSEAHFMIEFYINLKISCGGLQIISNFPSSSSLSSLESNWFPLHILGSPPSFLRAWLANTAGFWTRFGFGWSLVSFWDVAYPKLLAILLWAAFYWLRFKNICALAAPTYGPEVEGLNP